MEGVVFSMAGRVSPGDLPRAKPKGNPEEQPFQSEENHVLPDYFTNIYILFPKLMDGSVLAFQKS